ncbi:MAG: acyltransferase family protein [Candidatus Limnocylindrales bacterium]
MSESPSTPSAAAARPPAVVPVERAGGGLPAAPRAPSRDARLPGLDGLRAIAVLAVIAYHADLGWVPGGFLGVDVFFVISGFLITTLLLAERERLGHIDLRGFWLRRARRLLPALFLLLATTLTLCVLLAPDELAQVRGDTLAALVYVTNWYLVFRQQSYFELMGRPSPLLHLWSLAVEEQFYLVWPLVLTAGLVLLRRRGMLVLSVAGAIGSAIWMAYLYLPGADPSRVYYGTDTHATGLLLGAALALAWTPRATQRAEAGPAGNSLLGGLAPWPVDPAWPPARARTTGDRTGNPRAFWTRQPFRARGWHRSGLGRWEVLGAAALVAIGACLLQFDEGEPFLYRGGFVVLDLAVLAVIVAAVHPGSRLGTQLLDRQPLRWIGERSYGIYLWHWPIFTLTRPGLDLPLAALPDLALRLVLTFGAAEVSYRFVETPIRHGALGRAWAAWRAAPRTARLSTFRLPIATGGALLVVGLLVGARVAGATPPPVPPYLAQAAVDVGGPSVAGASPGFPGSPVASPPATAAVGPAQSAGAASPSPEGTTSQLPGPGASSVPSPTGPGASPAAPARTPAPTARPKLPTVLAVGDSVMLGAVSQLRQAIHGIEVDAAVGRPFQAGIQLITARRAQGLLPATVVVALGDNGWITPQQMDQLVQALGPRTSLLLVNLKEPRSWEGHDNAVLADAARRYPNVSIVDWHDASETHPEYFWDDGIHLRPLGATAYAHLLASAVARATAPAPSPSPMPSGTSQAAPLAVPAASAAASGRPAATGPLAVASSSATASP